MVPFLPKRLIMHSAISFRLSECANTLDASIKSAFFFIFLIFSLFKKPLKVLILFLFASFAKFLVQNRSDKTINKILNKGFQIFIENQIFQYLNAKDISIHFVGSIAFYLKDELKEALKNNSLKIGKVIKQPIDGLVSYHKKINK